MPDGVTAFRVTGDAYDAFMGRYSRVLAPAFVDAAGVTARDRVLDVGCGPGALTEELVRRVGAENVAAVDPSDSFVEACARRNPGVDVRRAVAEALPFDDATFDAALAQLVLHFVDDPRLAAAELRRVLRPGGRAAACVWDFGEGMRMLRLFWGAARAVEAAAPDEAHTMRFGREGEIAALFEEAGLSDVEHGALTIEARYEDFDDFWNGFLGGVGPAGAFCVALPRERQDAVREELRRRLGDPEGTFTLPARAWYAVGRA